MDGLISVEFKNQELVFKEGDEGMEFFIIENGEVECLKKADGAETFDTVRKLGKGDHFGELALINNDKRSLSIRAASETVQLLTLDREAFTRILGSIEKHLKKDYAN